MKVSYFLRFWNRKKDVFVCGVYDVVYRVFYNKEIALNWLHTHGNMKGVWIQGAEVE